MEINKRLEEKIKEIRKKAKRGRQKGYTHPEETKEKIGVGVVRNREEKDKRVEIANCCKQSEGGLTLEEALERAVERFQYCRYEDHHAPPGELFNVTAYYQRGDGYRYWAIEQKIEGIRNTIPAAKRLLASSIVSYVTIRIVVYEKQIEEDGVGRMKIEEDPAKVIVAKEDEEGKSYVVWYMDKATLKEREADKEEIKEEREEVK